MAEKEHPGAKVWRLKKNLNEEVGRFLMLGPDRKANVMQLQDVHAVVLELAKHWNVDLSEGAVT